MKSNKVAQCSDEQIKETIRYVMLLTGLRAKTISLFEEEEKKIIVLFIRRNYYGHTLDEIKLAFDMAITGELEIEDAKTYENFSCEYIGRIMTAYRRWASDVYNESGLSIKKPTETKELPASKSDRLAMVDIAYQDFLNGTLNIKILSELFWDIAKQEWKIELTETELMDCVSNAQSYYLNQYKEELKELNSEKQYGLYMNIQNRLRKLEKLEVGEACEDGNVNRRAKGLALLKWFHKIKEQGLLTVKK